MKERTNQICNEMEKLTAGAVSAMNRASSAQDNMRLFAETNAAYKQMESSLKSFGGILDRMRKKVVPTSMENDDVTHMGVDTDFGKFRVGLQSRFSVKQLDKEALKEWLRDNNAGDLITETINASSLSAHMKEHLEEGGAEPPTNIATLSVFTYATATKLDKGE